MTGLLLAAFPTIALAQNDDAGAVEKVTKMNKKAVEEYENLNFEEARKILKDALDLKPIPVRTIRRAALPSKAEPGEIARAGYSADRPFLLSIHRGCSAKTDTPQPDYLAHQCDSMPGDSGSPVLLLNGENASVVGIHTATEQSFEVGVGYRARGALGVSASAFEEFAAPTVEKEQG